jgi:MYXO-CTERM domain-containing protein
MQDSHLVLLAAWGEGEGAYPPEVSIAGPTEGGNVANDFVVHAFAEDKRGISHVDLLINGWKWDEVEGREDGNTTYVLRPPNNLPDGVLDIEVRGYNDLDVPASATVTVMKGAPCSSADTCLDGQLCEEGKCFWPPPTVPLGGDCVRVQDCVEGDCIEKDGIKMCVADCIPTVTGQCLEEEECIATSTGAGFCWPLDGGGGGCCSVGDDREPPWLELGLFLGVIMIASRRRRRRQR